MKIRGFAVAGSIFAGMLAVNGCGVEDEVKPDSEPIQSERIMHKFSPGDSVSVTEGPLKGLYGIIIGFYEDQQKYLVRFTGQQQLYYPEDEIIAWSEAH
ncbi:hypothetical protein [Arthrobacter zhaoguopingii]|uniref:hypothetical protein n=1 Tax=Arthrobacter zhaoguopingii TaxID=2681491 RepID=UPI001356DE06|nr:hypothetical protein [Arthrobacter zhaoguopingii]